MSWNKFICDQIIQDIVNVVNNFISIAERDKLVLDPQFFEIYFQLLLDRILVICKQDLAWFESFLK